MSGSRIWLSISLLLFLGIATLIGHFVWKNARPLPSITQVESHFDGEIAALTELTGKIDLEELYYRPHQAFPATHVNEVRLQLAESGLLSASVTFYHPGSRNSFAVVHDDSLSLWSLSSSPKEKGSFVTFCYSGSRQLIRYERITVVNSLQTVGFEIVFPPEELEESDNTR